MSFYISFIRVPKYDGEKPELREFIRAIETAYSTLSGIDEKQFVTGLMVKIVGNARETIESGQKFETIEQLADHLRAYTRQNKHSIQYYLREMQLAKINRNESIVDYGARIKQLVSGSEAAIKTTYKSANENDLKAKIALISDSALGAFIMGLYGSLEMRVSTRKLKSLNDAITIAILKNKDISMRYQKNTVGNRPYLMHRQSYSNQANVQPRQQFSRDNKIESVAVTSSESNLLPPLQFCPNCCLDLESLTLPQYQNALHSVMPLETSRTLNSTIPIADSVDSHQGHINPT